MAADEWETLLDQHTNLSEWVGMCGCGLRRSGPQNAHLAALIEARVQQREAAALAQAERDWITLSVDTANNAKRAEDAEAALARAEALADDWDERAHNGKRDARALRAGTPRFPAWIGAIESRARELRAAIRGEEARHV